MNGLLLLLLLLCQDWIVSPGVAVETATGIEFKVADRGELDFVLERADPQGVVIECNGAIDGVSIGLGENYRRFEVVRKEPLRVTLVAGPEHVSIGPLAWGDKKYPGGQVEGLALEHLELLGVTVDGRFAQSPLAGYMDAEYGDIILDGVTLLSEKSKTKWGSRIMGRARTIVVRRSVFLGGGIEWALYFDHPWLYIFIEDSLFQDWGRGAAQIVHRTEAYGGNGFPAAAGDCVIDSNVAVDNGWEGGGSAHNFTVTGWPEGTVYYRNNRTTSRWKCGGFITYYDFKQGGQSGGLMTETGFQAGHVVWKDNSARYQNGDRDVFGFGSVEQLEVRMGQVGETVVYSPKAAFDIAWNGLECGTVIESRVDPVLWNLQTGQGPWRANGQTLSAEQVKELWSAPQVK